MFEINWICFTLVGRNSPGFLVEWGANPRGGTNPVYF